MELPTHNLASLFAQLGLESTEEAIESFIKKNSPLPEDLKLHEADFWNPSQAAFLKQELDADADWAEIVDQLNAMLR